MIVNGMIGHIKVQRTRNVLRKKVTIECPDWRIEGTFPMYERLADFLWKIISEGPIPQALQKMKGAGSNSQGDFLVDGAMFPAILTDLGEDEHGDERYLLAITDRQLTSTYQVLFTMTDEIFRRSQYKLDIKNALINVDNRGDKQIIKSEGISESGFGVYWTLADACWSALVDCVILEFSGTDEENASMYYLTPDWVDKRSLLMSMTIDSDHCHWICELSDGSFRVTADFKLKID